MRGFNLMLDLEARKQWHVIVVALDLANVVGHYVRHELMRLLVNILGVDQDFTNIVGEVVTNCSDHQAGFLIDQEGTRRALGSGLNRTPQMQQVVQVPLQLFGIAADTGSTSD